MKKNNQKRKKRERKIVVNNSILDQITNSNCLSENEKISFLKYIWYLTGEETKQLSKLI